VNAAIYSTLLTVIGGVVIALITKRQNERGQRATTALAERTVDREEFDSITRELRQTITDLRDDLKAMRDELAEEVEERRKADDRAAEAERRADDAVRRADVAERRVDRLQRRVDQLERVLRDRHIPVPPVLDSDPGV
jgi:predicted RNase H-like nuclease (RuvC/YqgF family)